MINWFSGGKEKSKNTIDLLIDLHKSFSDSDSYSEKEVCELIKKYIRELKNPSYPVPYILNNFNLEFSKLLRIYKINLTDYQSNLLKCIRKVSNIRYGFNI